MNQGMTVKIRGQGSVTQLQRWRCVKCGRDFKLPKIPKTCEQFYSLCFTCYVVSCSSPLPDKDDVSA